MYSIFRTASFKKKYKKLSVIDKELLKEVIILLAQNTELEEKYKNHKLTGNLKEFRECHIGPDWLLIYKVSDTEIIFERTGRHSTLFE